MNATLDAVESSPVHESDIYWSGIDCLYTRFLAGEISEIEFSELLDLQIELIGQL